MIVVYIFKLLVMLILIVASIQRLPPQCYSSRPLFFIDLVCNRNLPDHAVIHCSNVFPYFVSLFYPFGRLLIVYPTNVYIILISLTIRPLTLWISLSLLHSLTC